MKKKSKIFYIGFLILLIASYCHATNYYVDTSKASGAEDGDGSYRSPWEYLSSIKLSAGDGVYLKEGVSTNLDAARCTAPCQKPIKITVPNVTLGCFDGNEDFDCDITLSTGAGMPKLDGGGTQPGTVAAIRANADNVTVQDIWVYNVSNHGIQVQKGAHDGVTFQRNRVEKTELQGLCMTNSDNSRIDGNWAEDINLVREGSCTSVGNAGITCDGGCSGTTISNNTVFNVYGEGIGNYWNKNYSGSANIIEKNTVHNTRSAGIHASEGWVIIRYNLVGVFDTGGDGYEKWFCGGTWPNCEYPFKSGGIAVNSTSARRAGANDNKYEIYGNFVHGVRSGGKGTRPGIACDMASGSRAQGDTIECLIYNNTLVDNEANIQVNKEGTRMGIQSYVINNVSIYYDGAWSGSSTSNPSNDRKGYFYDSNFGFENDEFNGYTLYITSGTASGNTYFIDDTVAAKNRLSCTGDNLYADGVRSGDTYMIGRGGKEVDPSNETTWDYNHWDAAPRSGVQGSNDATYADPNLVTNSGYVWPATRTAIDFDDFKLQLGSPAIGDSNESGQDLGALYNNEDYWGTVRGVGGYWDFGGHEYHGLSAPKHLKIEVYAAGSGKINSNLADTGKLTR